MTFALAGAGFAATPKSAAPKAAIPTEEQAPIALMIDMSSGQTLYAREADRRFMPASITKVMTTFLAFEWIQEGRLIPQQIMSVRPETFRKWSGVGSTMFLPHDARLRADQLLHGITTISANDASVVLAEGAAGSTESWVAAMNAKAAAIGMRDSHFGTPNGWMDEGRTFTTARDLSVLARTMIGRHPKKYRHFIGAEGMEYNGIAQRNHDPISGVVDGADGIKTGFTNQAGYGFLGSAQRDGRRLVMVIAASPRGRDRRDASRAFIEWGFASFESARLFGKGEQVGEARVQDGDTSRIALVAPAPIRVSLPKGRAVDVDLAIRYEGPVRAPIAKGETIAELIVTIDGEVVNKVPLAAERAVDAANPFRRVFNGIGRWL